MQRARQILWSSFPSCALLAQAPAVPPLLLLRQNNLRQLIARTVLCECVVGVDDGGAPVPRVDRDLEQIEQIAGAGDAAGTVGTDDCNVISCLAHHALFGACAMLRRLLQVAVPPRVGFVCVTS